MKSGWIFYVVAPAILTPYWLKVYHGDIFPWIKIYSVLIAISGFYALRFTKLSNVRKAFYFVFAILAINILEATVRDLVSHGIAHYCNAAAGILLIVTLLYRLDSIDVDKKGKLRDLHWDSMTLSWIIGYTIWNWVFVYLNYTDSAANHLAVLGAALIVGFIKKERWVQARAFTLGTYLMILFTFPELLHKYTDSTAWSNPLTEIVLAGISVGFMAIYSVWFAKLILKERSTGIAASVEIACEKA